jgi:hypothetical protein
MLKESTFCTKKTLQPFITCSVIVWSIGSYSLRHSYVDELVLLNIVFGVFNFLSFKKWFIKNHEY